MIWVVPDSAGEMGGYEMAVDANVLPMATMAIFTGLGVLLTLFGGKKKTEKDLSDASMDGQSWMYLLLLIGMLFGFLICLNFFGFIPAGIICIVSFMVLMGQKNILAIVLTSTLVPAGLYLIIRQLLNIPLP